MALAVAVTLMMTAGQLDVTLGALTRTAEAIPYDFTVYVSVQGMTDEGDEGVPDGEGASDGDRAADAADNVGPSAPNADLGVDEVLTAYEELYGGLSGVEGVRPMGWRAMITTAAVVPASMAGDVNDLTKTELPDGNFMPMLSMYLMDDALFADLCETAGVDAREYFEGDGLRAIGGGTSYWRDPATGVFTEQSLFASTGTIQVVRASSYRGKPLTSFFFDYDEEGNVTICGSTEVDGKADPQMVPLFEADTDYVDVDVTALVNAESLFGDGMAIALPLSKARQLGLMNPSMSFTAFLDCGHDQMMEVQEGLHKVTKDFAAEFAKAHPNTYFYNGVQNLYSQQQSMTNLVSIVRLFSLLFSVILVLIALANVFNTLTNSLALRRREFAVMQSIGMGRRTFRSMIASECMAYSVWGLVVGVIVSLIVGWALNVALSSTVQNAAFTVPWAYLGLSLVLVVVAMGLSVAWGLHLCRSRNIVEALRME